jgi:hypothetical protein
MAWDIAVRKTEIATLLKTITLLSDVNGDPRVVTHEVADIPRYPFLAMKFLGDTETKKTTGQRWIKSRLNLVLFVKFDDIAIATAQMDSIISSMRTKLLTYYDPTYPRITDNKVEFNEPVYLEREQPVFMIECPFEFEETVLL